MTHHDLVFEDELRDLFSAIPAPAPPAAWPRIEPGAATRSPWRTRRLRRGLLSLAAAAALAAVVLSGVLIARRHDASAIAVAARSGAAGLTCRLPISALSADHTTGFIVIDHGSASFQPVQTDGTTYARALGRWLSVLPQMVAPDGASYVTQDAAQRPGQATAIHVIGAAGDRVVLRTTRPVSAFAYTREGILLLDMSAIERRGGDGTTPSLVMLDPATGALRDLPAPGFGGIPTGHQAGSDSSMGYLRGDDAVWGTVHDGVAGFTSVWRYDLRAGTTTEWFDGRADGAGVVYVVGVDPDGLPIMQVEGHDVFHTDPGHRAGIEIRTVVLTAPHHATVLNQGRVGEAGVAGSLSPLSVVDGSRVWLAADDGAIWEYDARLGLREVAAVTTSSAGPPGVVISGPCS